ncbi:MAG: HAMP domain-containing sensor histidine kinase [Candidatus Paceibacterota bacterium]
MGSIIMLASTDRLVCWKLATVTALGLWLLSKHLARKNKGRQEKAKLEQMTQLSRFAELGRMSTGLFHDLISPLSAISLTLQEIETSTHPDIDGVRERLERSVMASRRMDRFITSIRQRIRSDEFREVFPANTMIDNTVGLFQYKASREGVELRVTAKQDLSIFGNATKFCQVTSNLISNAIDAYAGVEKDEKRERYVSVSLSRRKGKAIMVVEDQGSGIEPSVMPRIFEPFFTTKSRETGTGLGLWITKEIVEGEFGGSIRVKSRPGSGTRFEVIIRREKPGTQTDSSTSTVL